MPQYSFECQECKVPFDIEASMSEYVAMQKSKKVACPACGSKKVVRIITAPAVARSSSGAGGSPPSCCPGGQCG